MAAAGFADNIGAVHTETVIVFQFDSVAVDDFRKAGPALQAWHVRVIFGVTVEQNASAGRAGIIAGFVIMQQFTAKWRFGSLFTQDVVLLGR